MLRPFIACVIALIGPLTACGDDDSGVAITPDVDGGKKPRHNGGGSDIDANAPLPIEVDSGTPIPGDPPKELQGQACAVDTNKVYDLVTQMRSAVPAQLAVDVEHSRFALAYVDASEQCVDALYVSELQGAADVGKPMVALALDPCSAIDHASIAYNGTSWLLGSVDARMDSRDLWVQSFDGKKAGGSYRVTKNLAVEREVVMLSTGAGMLAAWVEQPTSGGGTTLKLRPLSAQGNPSGDEVTLDQPKGTWIIGGLSIARLGEMLVGLAYRRVDETGRSEIALEVLDQKGVRDRDAWVLSTQAGAGGSVDIASDANGAGVIYSLVQAESDQLWFQNLGLDGRAAKVMSGGQTGGAQDAERVVGPPDKAVDASLAKLPVGYAIAYRALPGGQVDKPRIRVQFLDRVGRNIGQSDAALASMYGGRTAIKAAYDGRVTVGYSDTDENTGETKVIAIKLPCVGGP